MVLMYVETEVLAARDPMSTKEEGEAVWRVTTADDE
jgi:hypothetical protein